MLQDSLFKILCEYVAVIQKKKVAVVYSRGLTVNNKLLVRLNSATLQQSVAFNDENTVQCAEYC